jgi:hypothetical protein
MFATLYFPFVPALASTAARKGPTPMLCDGRVSAVSTHMKRLTEACEDEARLPLFVLLQAGLQLNEPETVRSQVRDGDPDSMLLEIEASRD